MDTQTLYFIALLPPKEIRSEINQIKQHFADHYQSRAAFKSPPHITLQPPFECKPADLPLLEQCLSAFAKVHSAIPITLSGFGAFAPRVIFVNVLKTPALIDLHTSLLTYLEATLNITVPQAKQHPYSPHVTVAYRDLSRQNFQAAMARI